MFTKNRKFIYLLIISLLLLSACAGLQEQWNTLSQDEKARIVLGGMQDQLTTLFDEGKTYIDKNPQYLTVWKTKIIPAFDVANKALNTTVTLSMTQNMTTSQIMIAVQPSIDAVISLLTSIGVITGGK